MTPAERPLSPFLIYKPQLTSVLSFSHRGTGVALSVGTVFLVWWLVAAATSDGAFATVRWFFGSWLGMLMLLHQFRGGSVKRRFARKHLPKRYPQ